MIRGSAAARVLASALAAAIAAGALTGVDWLGPARAWTVAGSAAAALVGLWWPPTGPARAWWSGTWAAIAGVLAATRLGRRAPGEPVPAPAWWPADGDRPYVAEMADRILARDLPPPGVYLVVMAAAALILTCVVLGRVWRQRARGHHGLIGGVVVSLLVVPSLVATAVAVRDAVDRRVESQTVTATATRPAGRTDAGSGPAQPATEAWRFTPEASDDLRETFRGLVAVPGWDVVVAYTQRARLDGDGATTTRVVALSKTDGSELWQYWRHDGQISGVTVDPESGRVLLLAGGATVVLALDDGTQVAARPLPSPRRLSSGVLVGNRFVVRGFTRGAGATIGSAAVVWDISGNELRVLDVASGETLATTATHGEAFAAVTTTASPVIVQWDRVAGPSLLELTGADLLRGQTTAPMEWGDYAANTLIATDDAIMMSLETSGRGAADLVALSPTGDVLWRASEAGGTEAIRGAADLVAVTDEHVVAQWEDHWRLLSLEDGGELHRAPICDGAAIIGGVSFYAVADSERIYTVCDDRLAALRIDDLEPLWDGGPPIAWDVAFPGDGSLIAAQWVGPPEHVVAITD